VDVVAPQNQAQRVQVKGVLVSMKDVRKKGLVPKKRKGGGKKSSVVTDPTIDNKPLVTQMEVPTDLGSSDDEEARTELLDMDIMYEAECILKQKTRKGGKMEFLVRWVDKEARDTWTKETDLSDAVLLQWRTTHTRTGTKRKGSKISLINTPGAWVYRRVWLEGSKEVSEVR